MTVHMVRIFMEPPKGEADSAVVGSITIQGRIK